MKQPPKRARRSEWLNFDGCFGGGLIGIRISQLPRGTTPGLTKLLPEMSVDPAATAAAAPLALAACAADLPPGDGPSSPDDGTTFPALDDSAHQSEERYHQLLFAGACLILPSALGAC